LDVIKRASQICDKLIIAVAMDTPKNPLFSVKERVAMIKDSLKNIDVGENHQIIVEAFDGLLVHYAKDNSCNIIIRGLRAVSDFEYEFQLAAMNHRLDSEIQTIFIPASENRHFIASKLVKEVARLKGDISKFVTDKVKEEVMKKMSNS
jgi:pantetheine-phosphate adenylyltransferase